ncbi:MAG: UDP-N-acetylmuramate dehydrogenase, partial [Bacteroidetes bacterium]
YNTFGLDIKAKYFATFETETELNQILEKCANIPKLILGGGSNILFTQNFEGIILYNQIKGIKIEDDFDDSVIVNVGAGENWADFVAYAVKNGYCGIENLALIPGTVGASVIQNIGAYGVEVKDFVKNVYTNGKKSVYNNIDCKFGYRDSVFKQENPKQSVILSVTFHFSKKPHLKLDYGDIRKILQESNIENPTTKDVFDAICHIRSSKLPNPAEIGNAGSFFKNPEINRSHFEFLKQNFPQMPFYPVENPEKVKVPAGWLIEKAGWKGKKIENIGVHEKQALVLVNYGGGKGIDILNLANQIEKSIQEMFDISLEKEVNIL